MFLVRRPVGPVLAKGAVDPQRRRRLPRLLRGLNRVADRVTGVVQNGSLPVYAGVILLTAAVLPGVALLIGATGRAGRSSAAAPAQCADRGHLCSAPRRRRPRPPALRRRAVPRHAGYAMAALFVVQGAPDLALTQVAIETLSTVLFVLVLRRLPDRFERRRPR